MTPVGQMARKKPIYTIELERGAEVSPLDTPNLTGSTHRQQTVEGNDKVSYC